MTKRQKEAVRLNEAESIQIRESLKIQGLSIKNLAEKIGVDRTYIYQILKGSKNILPEHAFQIYQSLDQDPSAFFLINKYSDPKRVREFIPLIDQNWLNLYTIYIDQLRKLFLKQDTENRAQIICDLEKIANKYNLDVTKQPEDKNKTE